MVTPAFSDCGSQSKLLAQRALNKGDTTAAYLSMKGCTLAEKRNVYDAWCERARLGFHKDAGSKFRYGLCIENGLGRLSANSGKAKEMYGEAARGGDKRGMVALMRFSHRSEPPHTPIARPPTPVARKERRDESRSASSKEWGQAVGEGLIELFKYRSGQAPSKNVELDALSEDGCRFDEECDVGLKCVENEFSIKGVCVRPVDQFGIPTLDSDSDIAKCTFDIDCPATFECRKGKHSLEGFCIRRR